jgi:hypothetical protein
MAQITIDNTLIWTNGIEKKAIYLDVYSIADNLETEAKFYYTLADENHITLIAGNISIVGDDYIQWLTNNFSTNWIMNWISDKLNLEPITIN